MRMHAIDTPQERCRSGVGEACVSGIQAVSVVPCSSIGVMWQKMWQMCLLVAGVLVVAVVLVLLFPRLSMS